jgi:hypothetical protein
MSNKKYYEEHKEEISQKRKIKYQENKDEILQKRKQYYEANRELCLEYDKQYQQTNKERIAEYKKKWRAKRLAQNTSTPTETSNYCWLWFGKRLKDLTPEERKLYQEKMRELKNNQK